MYTAKNDFLTLYFCLVSSPNIEFQMQFDKTRLDWKQDKNTE